MSTSRDTPASARLVEAAFRGDLGAVRQRLAARVSVDEVGDAGWATLAWAANRGHTAIVDELVRAGANVDFQEDEEGESVLMFAMQQDDERRALAVVEQLLA